MRWPNTQTSLNTSTVRNRIGSRSFWRAGVTRLFGGGGRLLGLDIARGLAVLGMFVAHLYAPKESASFTWSEVFDGRSSILFAVLAGVSISIIAGRPTPFDGIAAAQSRVRILVRAALIFALGGLLWALHTSIAVILDYYAVLFVLCLPFLRWPARKLLILASLCAVITPMARLALQAYVFVGDTQSGFVELLVTGYYPALVWITYFLLGMGLGRLPLERVKTQALLITVGAILAIAAYGGAAVLPFASEIWLADPSRSSVVKGAGDEVNDPMTLFTVERLMSAAPHTEGLPDVIGGSGVAMAVIGLCLLLGNRLRWVLFPIAAVGAMALTNYTAHIVWLALNSRTSSPAMGPMIGLVIVALVVATLWRFFLGRGPLERLMSWVSHRAASLPAPKAPLIPPWR